MSRGTIVSITANSMSDEPQQTSSQYRAKVKHESNITVITNPKSLPSIMAITLKKMAVKCEAVAIASGDITPLSSPTVSLYDISTHWRSLADATKFKSANLPQWSEREYEAAGVIIATMTYLQRIGCRDIEKLIKDRFSDDIRKAL